MHDETIAGYLGKLAERTAAPAGGATAALNAAQAAALLAMSARFCDRDPAAAQAVAAAAGAGDAGHTGTAASADAGAGAVDALIANADRIVEVCTALIAADGEAYGPVLAAYKLPKATEEERTARSAAISRALTAAAVPPAEVIAVAARLLELARTLQPMVNRSIAPDVAAAVEAIRAAVGTSRTNIAANLSGITDQAARDRLASVAAAADALEEQAAQVIAAVRSRYS